MKKIKTIIALMVAFAALGVFADDSAPFFLNTAKGTRIAKKTELISYSTEWDRGSSVRVTADGVTLKEAVAPASGDVVWDGAKASLGLHTFTHVSGGKTLTAQFTVLGDDVVMHSGVLKSSEIWNTNKVHLVTGAITVSSGVSLTINSGAVVKFMPGMSLTVVSGGSCTASGVIFTHVNDDTIGGDTMMDEDSTEPKMGEYTITGNVIDNDATEYRYSPPQTLTSNISSDTRLRGYRTYIVSNSVTVASGATLTLQPGSVLKFNSGCSLTVNGTLDAKGTLAAPIIFTSLKDDEHGGDTNGDGDKTYPYAGDWARIYAGGTLNMNYCRIRHCNNNSDNGAIHGTGGTVTFDNGVIESSVYECVRMNSGKFVSHNSVFRDSSMGFGYYGGSGVYVYNGVVADCTIACRASNKHFYNTVFYRCPTFLESTSSSCNNCLFYNEAGYGAQTAMQVGANGNIWGDPKFVDADNGDFRIKKGSPCINAGDSANAPEFDYYGQPRDDSAPDIGIYELAGGISQNDLAAVSVSSTGGSPVQGDGNAPAARSTIGDTLTISYSVANVGKQAVSGSWRDRISLVSPDGGYSINLGTAIQTATIEVGATNTFNASFVVPTEAEGRWRVAVGVNAERDIYEGVNVTNNTVSGTETIEISMPDRFAADGFSGTAAKGVPAVAKFALDGNVPMVARINAPAGTVVYLGSGVMPNASSYSARAVVGENGGLIGIPAGVTSAYLLVETTSSKGVAFTMTLESAALAVQSVSPATLPYAGTTGLVIDGANFAEGCEVVLERIAGVSGTGEPPVLLSSVVSATRMTAQIDCAKLTAGATYSVSVVSANGERATFPNAVTVASVPAEPRLNATLDAPENVRRGRTLTVYIDYENTGNADMPVPIFELISTGQVFKVDGNIYTNSVKVMGLSAEAPVGTLRPGEPQRLGVTVTILAQNVKWKLRSYHAAQEGAKKAKFSLRELYDEDWVLYHVAEDDATVANLRKAIGTTFADYYASLGTWFGMVEPQTMDYEALKSAFGRYQYLKAAGMLDAGESGEEENSPAENAVNAKAGGTRSSAGARLLGNAACDHVVAVSPGDTNPNEDDGTLWRWCAKCGKWTLVVGKEWAETDGPNYITKVVYEKDFSKTAKTFIICHGNENSIATPWMGTMASAICTRMQGDVNVFGVNWGKGAHSILGNPYGSANSIKEVVEKLEDYLDSIQFNYAETVLIGHSHGAHVLANLAVRWNKAKFKRFVGLDASTTDNWVHLFNGLSPSKWIKDIRGSVTGTSEFYKSSWDMSLEKKDQLYGHWNFLVFRDTKRGQLYEYGTGGAAVSDNDAELLRHSYAHEWFLASISGNYADIGFGFKGQTSWKNLAHNNGTKDIVNPGQDGFAGVIRGNRVEMLSALRTDGNHDNWRYSETVLSGDHWKSAEPIRRTASNLARTIDYHIATDVLPDVLAGKSRISIQSKNCADNKTVPYMSGSISAFGNPNPNPWPWKNNLAYGVWLVDYEGIVQDDSSTAARLAESLSGSSRIGAETLKDLLNGKTAYIRRVGQTFVENPALSPLLASGTPFILPGCGDDGKASVRIRFDNDCFGSDKPLIYRDDNGDVKYRRVIAIAGAGVKLKSTTDENALPEAYEWDIYQDDNFVMREVIAVPANVVAVISKAAAKKSAVLKSARLMAAPPVHQLSENALKPEEVVNVYANSNGVWSISLNCTESYTTADEDEIVFNRFELTDAGNDDGAPRFQNNNTICDVDTVTVSGTLPTTMDDDGNLVCEGKRYVVQLTVSSSENEDSVTTCVLDVRSATDEDDGEDEDEDDSNELKSCDPNEMVGPKGFGSNRLVKPGEWMTYTIYFENKTDAEAAAASVTVTNPLSEAFDWSTFEMLDVGFGNQVDTGLSGKREGVCEQVMDGTNTSVRTELTIDETTGVAEWYLRIVDPNGDAEGWPLDVYAGFLPPNNPDTHCGEGHITYRVKLRDDVPLGTKIENSATIVFDFNEPIKTDPSWWNIVGGDIGDKSLDVTFAMGETELNQDGNYIYDGTAKTPGVSLKVKVGSEIKTLAEGRDFKCTYYDNVNANSEGNYPRISIEAIGNYAGSIVTNFVIAPREVTLTSGSASKVYDGTALVNSMVTVGGDGFVDGEGASYTYTGSRTIVGSSANAFSYTLNDNTKASNYTITTANGKLTVTKANVGGGIDGGEEPGAGEVPQGGVSKFDASFVYDGEGHTIDTNALTAAFGSAMVGSSVIEYAIDDGAGESPVLPWDATAPAYTNAGEYVIWYRVTNPNYNEFIQAAKVTITPRTSVVVDIVGNVATNVCNGTAQSVDGYTVAINDPLYKETDFEFAGNAAASGTAPGKYPMGLIASQFTNKSKNFAGVTFNVTDGKLVILEPLQKNVIFDAIGGVFASGSVVTQECEDVYLAFPVATREGYVFGGWYLGVTNGAPKVTAGAQLLVDDDHTLFAKWRIDEALMPGGASIFAWEAIDANTARITGFKNAAQKVSTLLLPDMMEGRFVTEIATGAFANSKSGMTKLVLPVFCTKIGDKAFTGVASLSEIVFADVRRWNAPSAIGSLAIGRYAFSGAGVGAVTLPKSVGRIGDYAFANCRKLTNLTILGAPTVGVMPLRRAGLDVGGVTVHLDPALANDGAYMETLKQECGNVTVRADAVVTRMTLSSLAMSASEIELSVSVEKAASWGKVDVLRIKVAYRESLSDAPTMLDPSSVTENADGSLTVKVAAPKGNSGFFQVVLEK